ncbi:MAG TPA: hypothetical protein PLO53_13140 [Candidatus Hydrogenedentes bacterium]|nr:hypothetical protein [Candidatus Hydrogenedentota bacterium]HPU98880.1 hypothetical protein [Candidatus Hydrogenedentota bacterium]
MRHVRSVTVRRAVYDPEGVTMILDRIFTFVLDLVNVKGKSASDAD